MEGKIALDDRDFESSQQNYSVQNRTVNLYTYDQEYGDTIFFIDSSYVNNRNSMKVFVHGQSLVGPQLTHFWTAENATVMFD